MEPPLELTWKSKREEQMKLANRRVNKPLVAAAFLFLLWRLRKLGVGISLKNLSLFLLTSLLSLFWFIPGAPKRSVTGAKEIYHFHPYFGHIKWIYRALTECPIEMQVDDAKRSGFQVTELVLFGPTRDLYIYAKADIEHVLKDNWKNYRKNGPDGGFLDYFGELLGRGIFAVDGEEWAAHRKTASFMFSNNALSLKMESSFAHHGELVADFLKEKAKSTEKFNIQEMMQALTFDSISDIAFGVEPGALRSMRDQGKRLEYLAQFDRVQQNITNRFLGPAFVFKLLRFLNLGAEQFIAEDCSKLREYVQEIIEKRKRETKEGRYDLLSLYIDAAEKSTEQAHLKDDDYLSDMIINFQIAGRDTTSCTLTNLVKELSMCPRAVSKMRAELEKNIAPGKNVTMADLKVLKYCCAVFNEVLRMYPPVAIDGRICCDEDTLPSGVVVPKGTFVWIPNAAIGRDPARWGDTDTFRPERWLEITKPNEPVRRVDEYLHPVFLAGPRVCIGKDAARLEVISIAKYLVQGFDFDLAAENDSRIANGPVQFYEKGLWGYVRERS